MELIANFQTNKNSIAEFARIMIPEALDEAIVLNAEESGEGIEMRAVRKNNTAFFSYRNLGFLVEDQKSTMIKILLLRLYGKRHPWGSLTGVRPTKLMKRFFLNGCSAGEIRDIFENFYQVSEEKAALLLEVVQKEMALLNPEAMNVYIGIPFCPTKCSYCSFASYELSGGVGRYYRDFLETLLEEIRMAGNMLKEDRFKVESIYIGGGTPGILGEDELKDLLKNVRNNVESRFLKEFTFEAGREDTLTEEKLRILKDFGVGRISLNPQTFKEATLLKINRKFDREHFDKMYELAKEMNFLVNMDFIIGLPHEYTEDILYTLEELEQYDPDNLTIHALAFKRRARLFQGNKERNPLDRVAIEEKIRDLTGKKGLRPYYLYRQKNLIDWGENTGYARKGTESLFNMEMIEENQCTLGLGGGAITKLITKKEHNRDFVQRFINPKDPALYIREMRARTAEKLEKLKLWSLQRQERTTSAPT